MTERYYIWLSILAARDAGLIGLGGMGACIGLAFWILSVWRPPAVLVLTTRALGGMYTALGLVAFHASFLLILLEASRK